MPRPVLELDNVAGIKAVVTAGLGVSIVPLLSVQGDDDAGHLIVRSLDPPIERALLLIQRKDKTTDPAIKHVRTALLATMSGRV